MAKRPANHHGREMTDPLQLPTDHDPANPLLVQTVRGIGYRLVTAP